MLGIEHGFVAWGEKDLVSLQFEKIRSEELFPREVGPVWIRLQGNMVPRVIHSQEKLGVRCGFVGGKERLCECSI